MPHPPQKRIWICRENSSFWALLFTTSVFHLDHKCHAGCPAIYGTQWETKVCSEKSKPQGFSCLLGSRRCWASREENLLSVPKVHKICHVFWASNLGGRANVQHLAWTLRNIWAYDLQHRKLPRPFSNPFSWFSPLLTRVCLATDCSLLHRWESGPGVQQGYNITPYETKKNVSNDF